MSTAAHLRPSGCCFADFALIPDLSRPTVIVFQRESVCCENITTLTLNYAHSSRKAETADESREEQKHAAKQKC